MPAFTDYSASASQSTGSAVAPAEKLEYWSLDRCRKAYTSYLDNKQEEIAEQKNARRYYHGSHWTDEQIKALNKRKQPVVTFNRIARKLNGVVGLIDRLKQDPKAYPRTPKHQEGAELATAVIRAVLDMGNWNAKAPEVALDAAVEGLSGIVIELGEQDDKGNYDVDFNPVEVDSFFYDPRSYRGDFSDARYMGEAKWLDLEAAQELFPDKAEELEATSENSSELTSNPDRESKWFMMDGDKQLVRLVDCWYLHKGRWCWTMFTGSMILDSGESYLFDERLKPICRYIMFSCNVDHDGDRYGFVRNMRSAQDEYNARRSRALFTANSRRLIMTQGSVADIERVRAEWARPDGVVVTNARTPDEGIKADDQQFDFMGQMKLMEDARNELDNYGPNQALIGDISNQSGRAIQLLQQAGMAELGPYILGYRGWKIRVYRTLFLAAKRYWTGEKHIRVTDYEGAAQPVELNTPQLDQMGQPIVDPMTGQPIMINAIGELDVDIILDEGADTINAQQDMYDTMTNVLPSIAPMLSPIEAKAAMNVLIQSSALPHHAKKAFSDATKQAAQMPPPPNPEMMKIEAKQKENQINLQFEAQKFQQNMQFKTQEAAFDQQMQVQKHQDEMAVEVFKAKTAVDTERMKLGSHIDTEREKARIHHDVERSKLDMQREAHDQKLTSEKNIKTESRRDPSTEKLAEAVAVMGQSIGEGMTNMAGAVAQMGEKIALPRKLVHDKSGNIVGSVPTETLPKGK